MITHSSAINIGFIGLSNLVRQTIQELVQLKRIAFIDMNNAPIEAFTTFDGILIADLTHFGNGFDSLIHSISQCVFPNRVFLIHSYPTIPESVINKDFTWVHAESIEEELSQLLTELIGSVGISTEAYAKSLS